MTAWIAISLPQELVARLDRLVPSVHESRSAAVSRAIELYIHRVDCDRDAQLYQHEPPADDELALADDPLGWDGTPAW